MSREVMQQTLTELRQVMSWIDNWSPEFTFDPDWPTDNQKANEAIAALEQELAKPEQEPVAVWELTEDGWDTIADAAWMETLPVGTKLYTAPPRKEWVGLTNEEIADGLAEGEARSFRSAVRWVEAKLKEKNSV